MNLFVPVRFVQLGEISIRKCIDGVSNETSREGEGFRLNEIAIIRIIATLDISGGVHTRSWSRPALGGMGVLPRICLYL